MKKQQMKSMREESEVGGVFYGFDSRGGKWFRKR